MDPSQHYDVYWACNTLLHLCAFALQFFCNFSTSFDETNTKTMATLVGIKLWQVFLEYEVTELQCVCLNF